jgi:hypothetical protein
VSRAILVNPLANPPLTRLGIVHDFFPSLRRVSRPTPMPYISMKSRRAGFIGVAVWSATAVKRVAASARSRQSTTA